MRRDDEAERALVGQVQQLLLRLDQRGEHGELLALEGAEIGVLGDAPALAQPLQHLVERRLGGEPLVFQPPELGKGGVMEGEPHVGPVDGDGDRHVLQHVGMRGDVARELGLDVLEVGEVLGVAHELAGAVERRLAELHQPARARDDDVMALRLRHRRAARAGGERAAVVADDAGGDLAAFGQRFRHRGVERRGIGAVAIDELQLGVAAPDRQRQRVERGAQAVALMLQRRALGSGGDTAGAVEEGHDVGAGDAAADGVELGAAVGEPEAELEGGAVGAEIRDRGLERRRVLPLGPRQHVGQLRRRDIAERLERAREEALLAALRAPERQRQRAEQGFRRAQRGGETVALMSEMARLAARAGEEQAGGRQEGEQQPAAAIERRRGRIGGKGGGRRQGCHPGNAEPCHQPQQITS